MASRIDLLGRAGIDYAEAMDRFGGNEDLFVRLATKYLNDPHFHALEAAMAEGDAAAASAKPIPSRASPVIFRSRSSTTWPRVSPTRCAATTSQVPKPSCPSSSNPTKPSSKRWISCNSNRRLKDALVFPP